MSIFMGTVVNNDNANKETGCFCLPQLFQPNLLCAGYESSVQGSCKGDSGGPLMFFKPSKYHRPRKLSIPAILAVLKLLKKTLFTKEICKSVLDILLPELVSHV